MNLPIGSIILWTNANIPIGWHVCDGGTYDGVVTPNMVGRFPMGASGAGDVGSVGGASSGHTHTNSAGTAARAAHSHGGSVQGDTGNDGGYTDVVGGTGSNAAGHNHSHQVSASVAVEASPHSHTIGTSGVGNNLPPNKKLYFIMRTI